MASSSNDSSLPMATLLHMITIKLSSSNFLLWRNQITPLLLHQNWLRFVDGSYPAPSKTVTKDDTSILNPEFSSWFETDQRVLLLLQSSLTEEAMAEILGLSTSHDVWKALESAYSHDSMERSQNLKDSLRQLKKGNLSVSEYGKQFKAICDKLAAIGNSVPDIDKTHWFLCGLGPAFETFSTAHRAVQPRPSFRDLLAQAEGHELFVSSLHGSNPSPVAFTAHHTPSRQPSRGRGRYGRGGNSSRGRGRRPPHCQLCRQNGHYANVCPDLGHYAQKSSLSAANLAQAFHADCRLTEPTPDWYVDSGATAHMAPSPANVDTSTPYNGYDKVSFGNGNVLPISHTGQLSVSPHLKLKDILIVPHLKKKLLSVSKLTTDYPVDFLFSRSYFAIQDSVTKEILAKGTHKDGLYVLSSGFHALEATVLSSSKASFELWHK